MQQHEEINPALLNDQVRDFLLNYKNRIDAVKRAYDEALDWGSQLKRKLFGWFALIFVVLSFVLLNLVLGVLLFMSLLLIPAGLFMLDVSMILVGLLFFVSFTFVLGNSASFSRWVRGCAQFMLNLVPSISTKELELRNLMGRDLFVELEAMHSEAFEEMLVDRFFSQEEEALLSPELLGAYLIFVRLGLRGSESLANQDRARSLILRAVAACLNEREEGSKKPLNQLASLLDFTVQYPFGDKTIRRELVMSYLSAILIRGEEENRAQFLCALFRRMHHFSALLPLLRDQVTPSGWESYGMGDFRDFSAQILLVVSERLSHKEVARRLNQEPSKTLSREVFKPEVLFGVVLKSLEGFELEGVRDERIFRYIHSVLLLDEGAQTHTVFNACETFCSRTRGKENFIADCLRYIEEQEGSPERYAQCLETLSGERFLNGARLVQEEMLEEGEILVLHDHLLEADVNRLKGNSRNTMKEKLWELHARYPVATESERGFDQRIRAAFQKSDTREIDTQAIADFWLKILKEGALIGLFPKALSSRSQEVLERSVCAVFRWASDWAREEQGLCAHEEIHFSVQELLKEIYAEVERYAYSNPTYSMQALRVAYRRQGFEPDQFELDARPLHESYMP